jgi:hypothetical protein
VLTERICSKIEVTGFCWLWTAALRPNGYAVCYYQGKIYGAHRLVYTLLVGPIPEGLELDHLCRVTRCVNPDHLEPVIRRENLRRQALQKGWNFLEEGGVRPKSARQIQEESGICKKGHVLAEVGVQVFGGSTRRRISCLACYNRSQCGGYHHKMGCPPKCPLQTYPR